MSDRQKHKDSGTQKRHRHRKLDKDSADQCEKHCEQYCDEYCDKHCKKYCDKFCDEYCDKHCKSYSEKYCAEYCEKYCKNYCEKYCSEYCEKYCKKYCDKTCDKSFEKQEIFDYKDICNNDVIVVSIDIINSTIWHKGANILIEKEIHVRAPATLTIQDNVTVKFKEGLICFPNSLPYASLVVDSGASIVATNVMFLSNSFMMNSTGGLIVCGTLADKQFENYPTVVSKTNVISKHSKLVNCSFNKLGEFFSDINALTLFNVKDDNELFLSCINISFAGDDALEIFGGNHSIDNLYIYQSADDGIDLDNNAVLKITKQCYIEKSHNSPLFDVIGDSASENIFQIAEGAKFLMSGVITDKDNSGSQSTNFYGSFSGLSTNQKVNLSGTAIANSIINGIRP